MNNNSKRGKSFNIIIAILVAVVLWLYVINVQNPTGNVWIRNIPITVQGEATLESEGLMVTDLSREKVTFKFSGKRKTLMKLSKSNVSATLDVSSIKEIGEWQLNCKAVLPGTVGSDSPSVSEWHNFTVTVTVAKQASKQVSLTGKFDGTVASGYQADPIKLAQTSIQVTGPEEVINRINSGVVAVTGENLKETVNKELPITLLDDLGNPVEDPNIVCTENPIQTTMRVVKVYEIPLSVEFLDGGGATAQDATYTITPQTITMSGDEDELSGLTSLSVGRIDLAQVFTGKNYTFPITIPSGAENRSGETEATVNVSIGNLPMKSLSTNQITCINVPDGYQAVLVSDSLQVWVRGRQDLLDGVTPDQISVVVDLSDVHAAAGHQRVAAQAYLNNNSGVGIVGTDYSVAVKLQRERNNG